jgi:hypothetical protein
MGIDSFPRKVDLSESRVAFSTSVRLRMAANETGQSTGSLLAGLHRYWCTQK